MAKTYEFEFDAPPDQLLSETLSAVSALGFKILEDEDENDVASITFNTGPSMWSAAGQDMTATALATSPSSSKLVVTGKTARKGSEAQYGSWGERGRIAKGLAMWVKGTLPDPMERTPTAFIEELATLAELHGSGALTDEEFASAKQRLLDA